MWPCCGSTSPLAVPRAIRIHSTDQISVLIEEADQSGQVLGQAPTPPRRTPRGTVSYTPYSKKSITHRVNNVGATAFRNIVVA